MSRRIFELCSKSLTLATPTSFTTRPIMQACWLSLLHRFGNRCKHHCSRLLAIFCGGIGISVPFQCLKAGRSYASSVCPEGLATNRWVLSSTVGLQRVQLNTYPYYYSFLLLVKLNPKHNVEITAANPIR
jgi:hypothetical protein